MAIKRIFRYLKGTLEYGLRFRKSKNVDLVGYFDMDFVGWRVDRRSTSGTCYFFDNCLVSWFGKKQSAVPVGSQVYCHWGLLCSIVDGETHFA